jgi:heme exporter protein CcmB
MYCHFYIEMLSLLRHPWHVASMLCGAVTMVLLLHFGMPAATDYRPVLPAFLLGVLVITLTNITHHAFTEDAREGRIMHWHTGGATLEWIVVSKFLAYLLCTGLPMVLMFSALAVNGGVDQNMQSLLSIASVLLLTVTVIISCGLLSGALSVCFGTNALMAYVLTLPFTFSIVIFAAPALHSGSQADATLLLALSLTLTPVTCFITARILRLCV